MNRQPTDLRDCTECGAAFDLESVNYYGPKCPECVDPEKTWPYCWECSEKVDPDEVESVGLTNRRGRHAGRTDYVPCHPDCAEALRSRHSRRP